MQLIRGLHNLRPPPGGCVATIGNFDGLHLGHQAVLVQVAEKAVELSRPSVVISFEPHPQEYFRPEESPPRLTSFREKLAGLVGHAVDYFLVLRFNRSLAGLSAEEFVHRVLVRGLGIHHLVVGDDFRFGRGRVGDYHLLDELGVRFGFSVAHTRSFEIDAGRVSSTRIRAALARGDLRQVAALLGRSYSISGRVIHGDERGRTIGFPTANVPLNRHASPVKGVFAVRLSGVHDQPLCGVANVGNRPTVAGSRQALLEVHLFDFDGDLYGRRVQVELLHRLRNERRFESLQALRAQIELDAQQARSFFSH